MTGHVLWVLLLRVLLLFAVGGILAFVLLLPHRGFHWLRGSAGKALRHPSLAGARQQAPGVARFAERHLHDSRPSWLRAVAGFILFVFGLEWFRRLLHGVVSDGAVVKADLCLHNTVGRLFQSEAMHRFYSLVTDLGSTAFLAPLALGLAAILWAAARRREALALVLAWAGAGLLGAILKRVIARPRPLEAQALFSGFSFPSAHSMNATAVYGFLLYLILRDERRRVWHWLAAVPLLALIGAIPVSRVYLGVHWPYDTVAGLAMAAAWLAVLITLYKYPPLEHRLPPAPAADRPWLQGAILAWVLVMAVYGAVLAASWPQRRVGPATPPVQPVSAAILASYPPGLPKTSADAIGSPMEPASFVLVGSRVSIEAAFHRAGWEEAETPSVRGLLRELWAVLRDRPDPRGPATPAFFANEPQEMTFEKPGQAAGSIRHRHHTRLWRTALCIAPRCLPVWVATASYDAGVKLVAKPYLVTHRIDPHVDRERDYIAGDLTRAGARELRVLDVTGPRQGHNAGGDSFTTDGRANVFLFP